MVSACTAQEQSEVAGDDEALSRSSQIVYVSTSAGPIHVFALDVSAGTLQETSQISGGVNPTYMAFSRDEKFAFAIDEANPPDSKVLSFAIDRRSGQLTPINSVETGAVGAPHLAVHPSGKWLTVAHYGNDADAWVGGQTVVIPIQSDGAVGAPVAMSTGPAEHPCVNAHQAVFTTHGKYLLVPCLGSDSLVQYRFAHDGALSLNQPAWIDLPKGSGPRHIALSPDQKHAYLLTELAGTIVWFNYDAQAGLLSEAGSVQATKLPIAAGGEGWSAHISVHPSGEFLYVSNRQQSPERGTENSLGVFSLSPDGEPRPLLDQFISENIDTPRDFTIDPSGRYLISVNQEGDPNVLVFRIDRRSGSLTQTHALTLPNPPAFVGALGSSRHRGSR